MLRLIQRIFLSANGSAPRQVVLCGVDDENGSSSVCARAGRTLAANSSRPVCVVDANVRSPRLSGMFGVEGTNPFSGPSASLREQCVKIGCNLWLAGPNILADNSRVLLPPDQLKERLAQLREMFEYMLIDAPGTSVCGDAQLLGLVADAAILVIEANSTRRLDGAQGKGNPRCRRRSAAGNRSTQQISSNSGGTIQEALALSSWCFCRTDLAHSIENALLSSVVKPSISQEYRSCRAKRVICGWLGCGRSLSAAEKESTRIGSPAESAKSLVSLVRSR